MCGLKYSGMLRPHIRPSLPTQVSQIETGFLD